MNYVTTLKAARSNHSRGRLFFRRRNVGWRRLGCRGGIAGPHSPCGWSKEHLLYWGGERAHLVRARGVVGCGAELVGSRMLLGVGLEAKHTRGPMVLSSGRSLCVLVTHSSYPMQWHSQQRRYGTKKKVAHGLKMLSTSKETKKGAVRYFSCSNRVLSRGCHLSVPTPATGLTPAHV
jgi:hypothetical protein